MLVLLFLVTAFFAINSLNVAGAELSASFFQQCDADEDRVLTEAELRLCLGDAPASTRNAQQQATQNAHHPLRSMNPFGMNAGRLMALLDSNGDGALQLEEYALAVKRVQGDSFREEHEKKAYGGLQHGQMDMEPGVDGGVAGTPLHGEEGEEEEEEEEEGTSDAASQHRFHTNGRGDLTPQQRAARAHTALPPKSARRAALNANINTHAQHKAYDIRQDEALHERLRKRTMRAQDEQDADTDSDARSVLNIDDDPDDWGFDQTDSELQRDRAELLDQQTSSDIKLTLRNGTVRHVSRDEMYRLLQMNEAEQAPLKAGMGMGGGGGPTHRTPGGGAGANAGVGAEGEALGDEDAQDADGYDVANLSSLHIDKPEMGHFVGLARWAVARLQSAANYPAPAPAAAPASASPLSSRTSTTTSTGASGAAEAAPPAPTPPPRLRRFPQGSIEQLRSLPPGGSPHRGAESASEPLLDAPDGKFDLFFELSVRVELTQPRSRRRSRLDKYEIHIAKDPRRFRYPHVAILGLWQLSNSGHRKTGSKDLLELPLVRRTRQPWQVGSRGAVRDGEADILGRMQGYLWYAADVCADLTAMALDELLLLLGEGAAGPTAADGGEKEDARGSGAGAGAEAAFLVLTGCCALFLSAMYFVVLPLVWLLLNAMDGAKEDEAAADPPLHEHEHEHVD